MKKVLRISRMSLSLFLCLSLLSVGLLTVGGPTAAQAKVIKKAADSHLVDFEELAQSAAAGADLEQMSAGMEDSTMWWILAGVGVLVVAGVVVAIVVWA
ncbi:MAG: hypothetical protein JRJ59_05085 [Deltaproteobacteria bacterium]|nr:hypothetical protein [Deltaproteobacteria bacterium]